MPRNRVGWGNLPPRDPQSHQLLTIVMANSLFYQKYKKKVDEKMRKDQP